jgi:alkanesulfonate monooxygenase SsuD/methylene tetrahydromethanopterin reductase-like flavin-dependent oxidoreductase (luciferase family)
MSARGLRHLRSFYTARPRTVVGTESIMTVATLRGGWASVSDMPERPFRFGVIGAPFGAADHWRETAVRAAEFGYATLLMPDVLNLLAPGPSLGLAAGAADIGVGTWVYSAPLRTPQQTAWEAHTLSALTGGRFEMGIGTGHPRSGEFARRLGMPFGSAAERLAQVSATIDAVHELDGPDLHTRVLVAAGGAQRESAGRREGGHRLDRRRSPDAAPGGGRGDRRHPR